MVARFQTTQLRRYLFLAWWSLPGQSPMLSVFRICTPGRIVYKLDIRRDCGTPVHKTREEPLAPAIHACLPQRQNWARRQTYSKISPVDLPIYLNRSHR
jgi:hypothetical protein